LARLPTLLLNLSLSCDTYRQRLGDPQQASDCGRAGAFLSRRQAGRLSTSGAQLRM